MANQLFSALFAKYPAFEDVRIVLSALFAPCFPFLPDRLLSFPQRGNFIKQFPADNRRVAVRHHPPVFPWILPDFPIRFIVGNTVVDHCSCVDWIFQHLCHENSLPCWVLYPQGVFQVSQLTAACKRCLGSLRRQLLCNLALFHAGFLPEENPNYHIADFLIQNQMILLILFVAEWNRGIDFSPRFLRAKARLDLLGQVFRVHLIDHALDRHQHPVPALSAQAVIIIIDGDKSYAEQRKHLFQILACFHEIAAQSREVLYHDAVDFPLLQRFQQPFKFRAIKVHPCTPLVRKYIQQHQIIPVVDILLDVRNLHFQRFRIPKYIIEIRQSCVNCGFPDTVRCVFRFPLRRTYLLAYSCHKSQPPFKQTLHAAPSAFDAVLPAGPQFHPGIGT